MPPFLSFALFLAATFCSSFVFGSVVAPICANPSNCTSEVQAALNNPNASTVLFRRASSPFVVLPLLLTRLNVNLLCEAGATVLAMRWAFNSTGASLLTIAAPATNVTVDGCTLRMWRSDYANPNWYRKGEWRMAINLESVARVSLLNSIFEESGGDGIYVGGQCCSDIVINNVTSRNNYRQGISVICANGLAVTNSVFMGTKGTAPQCGVDIEPDLPTQQITNVYFTDNVFLNNTGCGIAISVYALTNVSQPFSISFRNNLVSETAGYGVIWNIPHSHVQPAADQVVFADNAIENCASFAFFIFSSNMSRTDAVSLSNISVRNATYGTTDNIAVVVIDLASTTNLKFGPSFVVNNSNNRLFIYTQSSGGANISGTAIVTAPTPRGCTVENAKYARVNVTCQSQEF
jgi:hypothetical protein